MKKEIAMRHSSPPGSQRDGRDPLGRRVGFGTAQKLLLAFGWLIVLTVAISWAALQALGQAPGEGQATARLAIWVLLTVSVLSGGALAVVLSRATVRALGGEPSDVARHLRCIAEGDLAYRLPVRPGDDASILSGLAQMQQRWIGVVAQVREGAEGVAMASAEIATGNMDLSQRTELQAAALQRTAGAMDALRHQVMLSADHAGDASGVATQASVAAAQGGAVVGGVVETMRGISTSSSRIAEIIGVIDSIAFQTNILALNAAVEAARAGEQGRGFAVVAGEVRSLAQRSAAAAREIKQLITDSGEQVQRGSRQVDGAGETMQQVVDAIGKVDRIVNEISAASAVQARQVSDVGEAVTQMDQTTQQNAALVEQSAAAATSLRDQAQQLVDAVAFFRLHDTGNPERAMAELEERLAQLGTPRLQGTERVGDREVPGLYFGSHKLNKQYALVDELKKALGATATLFVKSGDDFVRVSTNVLTPEGMRGVGTPLARAKAHEAVSRGQSFRGEVDVLGTLFDACYRPIKDGQGHVIGVSYVGFKKA
ncbi:methyl-accepting chemotaxis protein [Pelomonas saccharophila]|uniref:Methyl-accepting chemotaxis protein n=1 Tax=Roseateles saccharophilus TaxID=304 RepID=A0ABU1YVA9_ROSSA|nr:methyl-accepting chemotaxis protein [Roseateles saccharophilus]